MIKRTVTTLISEATRLLKADSTSIVSNKDIVNQLAWLLFLKCLEMSESHRQDPELFTLQRANEAWQYSWTPWVDEMLQQQDSQVQVEESRRFLHKQFHPKLGELFSLKSDYLQVNTNFITFQHLLQLIYETELDIQPGEDYIAQLYSTLFALLTEENKKMGIFATPPAITHFMVQVLDPGSQDIVYDPACGTGDFLLAAKRHCEQKNDAIATNNLHGRDSAEQIIQLARMNMLLHGINPEQVQQQAVEDTISNALERHRAEKPASSVWTGFNAFSLYDITQQSLWHPVEDTPDQGMLNVLNEKLPDASVILMHPPLGRYPFRATHSRRSATNTSASRLSSDCYEALFLQHSWRNLQSYPPYARCGMVVSSAFLDGREEQKVRIRKHFLQKWNILMIVWLPKIEFSPTSSEKTFLLFFDDRPLTKKILHYNLALRLGHKTYTYAEPIQDTDFAEVREAWELWKNHLEHPEKVQEPLQTEYQWIMTYDPQTFYQRPSHDPYTLLPLPPSKPLEKEWLTPDDLLRQIEENHLQQQQHIQRLRELLSLSNEEGNNA